MDNVQTQQTANIGKYDQSLAIVADSLLPRMFLCSVSQQSNREYEDPAQCLPLSLLFLHVGGFGGAKKILASKSLEIYVAAS